MCGIFFSASSSGYIDPGEDTLRTLSSRGPDSFEKRTAIATCHRGEAGTLSETGTRAHLTFVSTVLALRGDQIQAQPVIDESTGSILCWNGEAWKINGDKIAGNDTTRVFEALLLAAKPPQSATDRVESVLTNIAGPYAFVFYDAPSQTVYFGRDQFGRRSLMISNDSEKEFILASTSIGLSKPCREVETTGIYKIRLQDGFPSPERIVWTAVPSAINKNVMVLPTLQPRPSVCAVEALVSQLRASLHLRASDIPALSHNPFVPGSSKVAVLFSGGLDCTLLARIVHDLLPINEPIDLLNVAFENPRTIATAKASSTPTSPYESCPDRMTGRSSFAELTELCPSRNWRFISIDIPISESSAHRTTTINLMCPHNTEMDLSIAMALYFAARGKGSCVSSEALHASSPTLYTTSARVLLSGLGADELFAGYTRHATSFSRAGFAGLVDELELDFRRIGTRNLGRDDRVISHWGKEVRYPYLDETFVEWALGLPVWEKCGFRAGKANPKHLEASRTNTDIPDSDELDAAKMLLRLAARHLGMKRVATERKRAIQFGARTAKMDVSKTGGRRKGTDVVE